MAGLFKAATAGARGSTPVRKPLKIEAVSPPDWVVEAILRIFRAADVDVGGVEYLQSERDGQIYFYDVNTLSNFVTDAPSLLGSTPPSASWTIWSDAPA